MVVYTAMIRRTLGPLVLRGLGKIGASEPIFDWGSFSMSVQNSLRQPFGLTPPSKRGRQGGYAANRVNNNLYDHYLHFSTGSIFVQALFCFLMNIQNVVRNTHAIRAFTDREVIPQVHCK